jgi:hypothetical protein
MSGEVPGGSGDRPGGSGPPRGEDGWAARTGRGIARLRVRPSWAGLRPSAPFLAFAAWFAVAALVALVRVRPWNEWRSWRRWLRADERGWELLLPGVLLGVAVLGFTRAHDRWEGEGWSPEVVGLVLGAAAAGAAGAAWGLYTLGLRPFAG